MSLGFF